MKKGAIIIFLICLTALGNSLKPENALAEEEEKSVYRSLLGEHIFLTLGLSAGFIRGHNTYNISFDNPLAVGGHGESELEWPLNNFLSGVELNLVQKNPQDHRQDRARLNVTWFISVNEDTCEKMKDSDWIENDIGYIDYYDNDVLDDSAAWAWQHAGKDIYSESDADLLRGHTVDINYTYNFWPLKDLGSEIENFDLGLGPILGYRYQYFSHACRNLDQVGYGPYGPGPYDQTYKDPVGMTWIKYKVHEHMCYVGGSADLLFGENFGLNVRGGYIPWVSARDEDTHLYPTTARTMVSTGDCEGDGWLANASVNWEFFPDFLGELGAEYLYIKATGHMEQKHYLNEIFWWSMPAAGMNEWVETSLWTFFGKIKFRF